MQITKECKVFQNFDISVKQNTKLLCVYFKNEAITVDNYDNVFILLNNNICKLTSLSGQGVVDFAYAQATTNGTFTYHMMALTSEGKIFAWGKNDFNQVTF